MTPELTKLIAALRVAFAADFAAGNIVHLGTYNCRRKNHDPNGPWSEHAWPNAVDIMLRNWTGRKALGDRIAAWCRSRKDLASEVFWWVSLHYDHVHATANPRRNYDNKQIPPCATGGNPIGDDDVITRDSRGSEVIDLQHLLNGLGLADPKLTLDGVPGDKTFAAYNAGLKLIGRSANQTQITAWNLDHIVRKTTTGGTVDQTARNLANANKARLDAAKNAL